MAIILQSVPERWDIRERLRPGKIVEWYAGSYQSILQKGRLVLFWSAKGNEPPAVRGFYGWGISTENIKLDHQGKQRLPVRYVEQWILQDDIQLNKSPKEYSAPIPASAVFNLSSWTNHLLAINPRGSTFIVNNLQMKQLVELVKVNYPNSQLESASLSEELLDPKMFIPKTLEGGLL